MVLSQAFARHPKVFNRLFVAMIEAGESSGTLDQVLDRVATQIEKETQIKRRVKGAMVYPDRRDHLRHARAHVHAAVHRPRLRRRLRRRWAASCRRSTQFVMHAVERAAGLLVHHLPGDRGAIFGFRRLKRTEQGRQVWDRFKLKIPMKIGDVVQKIALARFSRTLSTLVAAGVDIIKALEITGATAGNWVIEESLANVRERVHEGIPISQPLPTTRSSRRWSARW